MYSTKPTYEREDKDKIKIIYCWSLHKTLENREKFLIKTDKEKKETFNDIEDVKVV